MQEDQMAESIKPGEEKAARESVNFIHSIIEKDLEDNLYDRPIKTRFPPEPNGYLHIGHAKSICLNFSTAEKYNGLCNLRFDDTNPLKEDTEYVESIMEDVKWLGFDWDEVRFASDYFETMYDCAVKLIKKGKAFVCGLNADEMREYRGTLTEPGKESPFRNRSAERREICGWRDGASGKDRYGFSEYESERPGALPDLSCGASQYRDEVVCLSDVRFCTSDRRRRRRRDSLDLHDGV